MSPGRRIRHYRMLRGMTQKALGIAAGFPPETADIRIAQYESGVRTPKHALLCTLAEALGVSPSALDIPRIKSHEVLKQLLLALEDEYGLTVTITETLQKTVTVEADSREEAERQVEESWNNSEYILDADSFVGVDFSARTNERSREYER